MTQKPPKVSKPGGGIMRALGDLVLLTLLLSLAGFGGYYFGTQQRLAPVQLVGPGTPGASNASNASTLSIAPTSSTTAPAAVQSHSTATATTPTKPAEQPDTPEASQPTPQPPSTSSKKPGKLKYWIASTGSDYVGYSIAVTVNGTQADNFFAPGKAVDITKMLKKGDNEIGFNAQDLGDKFNLHKGDKAFALTLKVVSGPTITENFKKSDEILTYSRNASESDNFTDTMHFRKD